MAVVEKLYTAEEFWRLASLPENEELRLELDDGVIVDMGSSSRINTVTAMRIGTFLNNFVISNDLGYVTGADGGFQLSPRRVQRPDVAFVAKTHEITLEGVEFSIAPDLAVEVVSPDEDIFKKAREYFAAGTKIVWAVYADEKQVYVFLPDSSGSLSIHSYGIGDTLDGGDVLPGFTLPVRDIFP